MEKKWGSRGEAARKHKLPVLTESKSQLHTALPHLAEITASTDRLKDLRKLYFQYKSNAQILTNSPYFTNRQQQKQVVALISANKYELDQRRAQQIAAHFTLSPDRQEPLQGREKVSVQVRLMVLGRVVELEKEARSVGELESLLKIQYACSEYRLTGTTKKAETIVGFESANDDSTLDYHLSLREQPVPTHKIFVKPIFQLPIRGKVRLQHFRLVRCLGSGGFSLVYLARDSWSGQYYALKLINKQFILESERETIVENERFVLGELHSPFVTELKYCFQTKNHFAFMVQYCPGGELFYQLKKVKKMTEAQAKFYFLEILIGLDYIHQKNIVYRDLKPENLLIAVDGHIKIADFGLAKPLLSDKRKVAYSFCGSPEYMAPEMLLKNGHTFTLDYYCLGALLYELVLGIPPYYSLNHEEIYRGILHEELTFPTHTPLSDEIKNLLRGLLQKNPSKRLGHLYGVKEILIHPWVGKVNRKLIEQKGLIPPFLPDLASFNFDESDLREKSQEVSAKIDDDLKNPRFETYFNSEFYFEHPGAVMRQRDSVIARPLRKPKMHSKNKQNRQGHSLEGKPRGLLRRTLSQKSIHA